MATLAELQAHRSALLSARASGVRRVRDASGEEVEYRTDSEMKAAIAFIDSEIAAAQRGPRPVVIRCTTSKGT
ncbi:MAG TPA: hypothetical protein PKA33_00835 [Amaricoccus sp.]|uniref:phage head-tail joining protein n=1 Tax=Amaricoccus sp. TaxID=1872485 RepID=UPI002BDB4DE2|nr:hypothetical protein [Amaricoccus sp.]HMQ91512.1 hypothetical protein [Amaricoccus sp.]HMR50931.1 hypothetical protein [Amaricoccus sp.]HMR58898.1 hypothetical protein [Amaricoccus sp.]HMT97890.1 hypothetical protein [Amaricoccus sp.]